MVLQWSVVEDRAREGYLYTEHISWLRQGSSMRLVAVVVFVVAGAGAVVAAGGAGVADMYFDRHLLRHKRSAEAAMWELACRRKDSLGLRCEGKTLDLLRRIAALENLRMNDTRTCCKKPHETGHIPHLGWLGALQEDRLTIDSDIVLPAGHQSSPRNMNSDLAKTETQVGIHLWTLR